MRGALTHGALTSARAADERGGSRRNDTGGEAGILLQNAPSSRAMISCRIEEDVDRRFEGELTRDASFSVAYGIVVVEPVVERAIQCWQGDSPKVTRHIFRGSRQAQMGCINRWGCMRVWSVSETDSNGRGGAADEVGSECR